MANIRSIGGNGRDMGAESFEQSFQTLQEVVRKLSEGNLTLQDALAAFEEGMALADRCGNMLEEAELRVKQVGERAMHAGSAAVREAAAPPRSPLDLDLDEQEIVGFEIEAFESVIFDTGRKTTGGQAAKSNKQGATGKAKPPVGRPPGSLDALFDEDD